jgi:hypothetical protein
MPSWGRAVSAISPLTYASDILRYGFEGVTHLGVLTDIIILLLFTVIFHSIYPVLEGKEISWAQSLLFILETVTTVGYGDLLPFRSDYTILFTVIKSNNLWLRETATKQEFALSADGTADDYYDRDVCWSPDSTRLAVMRVKRAQEHKVHFVESSPKDQLQPKLYTIDYLKEELVSMGLSRGKIGMELGEEQWLCLPYVELEKLRKNMPEATFMPSNIFWDLRLIKSKAEVDLLRKNAQATCIAEMKSFAELQAGMTESEFLKIFLLNLIKEGFGFPPAFALTRTGPKTAG